MVMAETLPQLAATYSVLQRVRRADVVREPFPHIVIKDAIPADLCRALIEQYPAPATVQAGSDSNERWSLPAVEVVRSDDIAPVWKAFTAYHASSDFWQEVVDVFGGEILRLYPAQFRDEQALRKLTLGWRDRDSFEDHDFLLDAQIAGNTPVTQASSVKTVHVDSNNKLFAGLFYLRAPDDNSVGGDLDIVRFRPDLSPGQYRRRFNGVYVDDGYTEHVRTVDYAANVLVMFVNGPDSLHGVTVRQPTPHRRLFLNLLGEVDHPLFDIPQHWERRLRRFPRIARKRLFRAVGLPVD